MSNFVRGKYAGETVEKIQKRDPEYVSDMYRGSMNVFNPANLSSEEVEAIRKHDHSEQLKRDCY